MRKLASVQKITKIRPIEGRDRIDMATVANYDTVVKKGDFSVGDLVVYVECDSLLPERPEFEFMRDKHFKVRIWKLKGAWSYGITFPLSILPERDGGYSEGDDVTDILGITKYDNEDNDDLEVAIKANKNFVIKYLMRYKWFREMFITKKTPTKFPTHIVSRTDETRIQSCYNTVENNAEQVWVGTEKIDGSSITCIMQKKPFGKLDFSVYSRNLLQDKNSHFVKGAIQNNIEETMKMIFKKYNAEKKLVIQGEIIGAKIQGNKYKVPEGKFDIYVFNLIIDGQRVNYDMMKYIIADNLNIVPEVYRGRLDKSVEEIVKLSEGKSKVNPDIQREGVVFRLLDDYNTSFKAINPKFMEKYK